MVCVPAYPDQTSRKKKKTELFLLCNTIKQAAQIDILSGIDIASLYNDTMINTNIDQMKNLFHEKILS